MMQDFSFTTQQTRFHGITWEPKQFDRVMIIIHGIGEHVGRYAPVAAYFNQYGFLVTGIDHYGHGKSDGKRGTTKGIQFIFDYLQDFIDEIKQRYQLPIVLYGHSMGGGITTGFLLKRQPNIQAAIISAPLLLLPQHPAPWYQRLVRWLSKLLPHFTISQGLDIRKISHDTHEVNLFRQDPLRHDRISFLLGSTLLDNAAWSLENARRLKVPTLLIHGDQDEFTSIKGSRLFSERAPKELLTYKEWPGYYHEMHNEIDKKAVLDHILSWLNQVG